MTTGNTAEVVQLAIGFVLGFGLSLILERHGFTFGNRETRWQTLATIVLFFATYLLLTEPLVN